MSNYKPARNISQAYILSQPIPEDAKILYYPAGGSARVKTLFDTNTWSAYQVPSDKTLVIVAIEAQTSGAVTLLKLEESATTNVAGTVKHSAGTPTGGSWTFPVDKITIASDTYPILECGTGVYNVHYIGYEVDN